MGRRKKKKGSKLWIIIAFVLLFIAFGSGGKTNSKETNSTVLASANIKATETPYTKQAPTAEPKPSNTKEPEPTAFLRSYTDSETIEEQEVTAVIASTPFMTAAPTSSPEKKKSSSGASSFREASDITTPVPKTEYVLNRSSMKFHVTGCRDVKKISTKNRVDYFGTRSEVISMGYKPCGHCNP